MSTIKGKSCPRVSKLFVWLLSFCGRCLKVTLQTHVPKKFLPPSWRRPSCIVPVLTDSKANQQKLGMLFHYGCQQSWQDTGKIKTCSHNVFEYVSFLICDSAVKCEKGNIFYLFSPCIFWALSYQKREICNTYQAQFKYWLTETASQDVSLAATQPANFSQPIYNQLVCLL